uniref:ZP domain-containing protein n=1 Tax=Xiphophorus couchianus TaxID=32473 RepID=A0A3B5LGK0_9TELE
PLLNILHLTVFMFSCFAGAAAEKFDKATKFNLTLCPISFYQNVYQKVYVNFTNKNFAICFNGFYNSESNDDCIIGPKPDSAQAKFIIREKDSSYEAQSKAAVKTIRSSMTCSVHFDMINIGIFKTGNTKVFLLSSGVGILPNSTAYFEKTCRNFICSIDRSVTSTGCGEQEECDGSGRCFTNLICTVTGPTVIDFQGQQSSVKDRCVYSLVSDSSSGFEVLANFQERRRRDVSFLDSVSLRPAGSKVYFHLEQGGRIKTVLTLKSPVQQFKDISLSKDKNGLTATSLFSGLKMSALFDGYTAQIHMRGRNKQGSNELIIILQLFNEVDLLRFFLFFCFASCERQYEDPVDSQIDRNLISEQCNLLRAAPFSSCNKNVDPTPYISACNRTLCEYSSADGLGCQFLWAYATACKLKSNITLGRWWLDAGCSEPQALCQDKLCSDHEFCGRKHSGKTGCLCRALFASKYKLSGTLGEPAVCRKNSGSITLVGCLLEEKGINYSVLHLNDRSCRGVMDEENHMVTFSFDSSNTCGTEIMNNGSWINYKNTIITQSSSDVVTRHDQVFIDFSCYHTQPDIKIVALKIKDNSVVQHIKSGEWSYSVSMKVYEDGAYTRAVNSGVLLNQKIWVELKTDGLDAKTIAVVMDSCWATSKESHDLKPRYDLIIDGCADPNDGTVEVEGNGAGTSTYFSFNMFEFSGNSGDVYLHCKIQLCPKQENNCIPDCYNEPIGERRSVRSPKTNTYPAIISMAWGH